MGVGEEKAAYDLRENIGISARIIERANVQLESSWKMFNEAGVGIERPDSENEGIQFMDARSKGEPVAPKYALTAELYKKMETDLVDLFVKAGGKIALREHYQAARWTAVSHAAYVQALGEARTSGLIDGSFDPNGTPAEISDQIRERVRGILKESSRTDNEANEYTSKQSLEGSKTFKMQKTFDTIEAARSFGLELIDNNPAVIQKLLVAEMARAILGASFIQRGVAEGWISNKEGVFTAPEGFVKLSGPMGDIMGGRSIPVFKMLSTMAKSSLQLLYRANFGALIFADPDMKIELGALRWEFIGRGGVPVSLNIHQMKASSGTPGKSYSQLVIENLLLDHARFESVAPTIFARLEAMANSSDIMCDIIGMPTFNNLRTHLPVGGRILKGHVYARTEVANVLNNFLSPSLYQSDSVSEIYKAWMGVGNLLNQFQLGAGISLFHASFTTGEALVTSISHVVQDIYKLATGGGSIKQVGDSMLKAITSVLRTPASGKDIIKSYRSDAPETDPNKIAVIKALELVGASIRQDPTLQTDQVHAFLRDWFNENKGMAMLRSPFALIELMAAPIMSHLVPMQKVGVFAEAVLRIMEANPSLPGESLDQHLARLRPLLNAAWADVDARLGQVNWDRLFIKGWIKSIMQGTIRAPGWSGGTLHQILGSVGDTFKFFNETRKNKALPKELPPRVAYVLSLLLTFTAANALLTLMFTGKKPDGLDFWAFKTGRLDEYGNPERFVLPSYVKDLVSYSKSPIGTLIDKQHPILSLFGDLWKNQDYYGIKITNEDDSSLRKLYDRGKYVAKAFEPFWLRGIRREQEREAGFVRTALPLVGVMPAPRKMTQTKAAEIAAEFVHQNQPIGGRTKKQAEINAEKYRIILAIRKKQPINWGKEISSGNISASDVKKLQEIASMSPLQSQVKRLSIDQAEKVFSEANAKEKKELMPIIQQKRINSNEKNKSSKGSIFSTL